MTYGAGGTTRNAHGRADQVDQAGPRHRGDGAPVLRRRADRAAGRRSSTRSRRRASRTCSPCAATRPAARPSGRPHPGGLQLLRRADPADRGALRLLRRRRLLPRGPPGRARPRERPRATRSRSRRPAPRFLITQLFFDNELYFDFVEQARAAGITVPIVPGIMPITNYGQIKRFTEMCGASIPDALERELNGRADDPEAVAELGVAYATLQCSDLLARGAPGIHFYTLNRSPATRAILAALRAAHPWTARPLRQPTGSRPDHEAFPLDRSRPQRSSAVLDASRAQPRSPPTPGGSGCRALSARPPASIASISVSPSRSSSRSASLSRASRARCRTGVRGPVGDRSARRARAARATARRLASARARASRTGRPWPARHSWTSSPSTTSRLDRNSPAGSGV